VHFRVSILNTTIGILIMVYMMRENEKKKRINISQIANRKSRTDILNALPISSVTHTNTNNVIHQIHI
jgi:3'-phosphoadenosine 5'-phosphosulfate sulfotransferase (PAPS reductase)/FAD synthetase